jgi:hypothetical protein
MNNENNPKIVSMFLGSLTADVTVPVLHLPKAVRIKSVRLMNGAGISALDDPKFTLQLKNGSTVVAQLVFDSTATDIVANVAKDLSLLVSQLAAGTNLTVAYDETENITEGDETFIALTDAKLLIEYYPL